MVSTRSPTFKSYRPFNNPLVSVPKAPITIGIIVTVMFHSFFNSLARSSYVFLFSHSFSFIQQSRQFCRFWYYYYYYYYYYFTSFSRQRLLVDFPWSLSVSKSFEVSRSFLIMVDLNYAVVWIISILSLMSNSFRGGVPGLFGNIPRDLFTPLPSCSTDFKLIWQILVVFWNRKIHYIASVFFFSFPFFFMHN